MVIAPFRGVLYNQRKIKNLANVVTPPYDIISPAEQKQFYARSPYNMVHLDLNAEKNKYQQAADYFRKWQEEEILLQDQQEAFYVYSQEFKVGQERKVRSGFFALSQLEATGSGGNIHPHEFTLAKPKEDRLQLMRACQANFSPIFYLYEDKGRKVGNILKTVMKKRTPISIRDDKKIYHRLWRVVEPKIIARMVNVMKDKQIYIADGHHRYEAAVRYSQEMHQQHPEHRGIQPYDYVLGMFVAKEDKGLIVFPTHRILRVPRFSWGKVKTELSQYFAVEQVKTLKTLFKKMAGHARGGMFGVYAQKEFFLLRFRTLQLVENLIEEKRALAWKRLDVAILHKIIIEKMLGITAQSIENEEGFRYTRDEEEAKQLADSGHYDIAFFMNPTKISQIIEVANAGERMPQKSTYFYPKLITGLVINRLG